MNSKLIGRGTTFHISYKNDGVFEEQNCILATTHISDYLFQIVVIKGYHAGEIDGFVEYEFQKGDFKKRNFCTFQHLQNQLKHRIYSEILEFRILEGNVTD